MKRIHGRAQVLRSETCFDALAHGEVKRLVERNLFKFLSLNSGPGKMNKFFWANIEFSSV